MLLAALAFHLLLAAPQLSSASEWVVETNSLRVKEPNDLQGEFDAAIGDVRPS